MEHKPKNQYQHIIYIGGGASVAMDTLAGQAERLWLIDAADQVVEQLRLQAETLDLPICIQQALVMPQTQQATFYEYNLPWVNGPTPADDSLHRLYPGLCCTRETQQQGLGLVDLLQQCLADAEQTSNNLLIIDLEQQTQALLHTLAESEVLHCFAQVLVVPPHRGQPINLPSSLQAVHKPLPAGMPQNTQSYQLAQWVLELQLLQQQLAETKASQQKHKDWAHSLKQQLESSCQEEAAKASALQQAEQQLNQLAKECEHLSQQLSETKISKQKSKEALSELKAEFEKSTIELNTLKKEYLNEVKKNKKLRVDNEDLRERFYKKINQ